MYTSPTSYYFSIQYKIQYLMNSKETNLGETFQTVFHLGIVNCELEVWVVNHVTAMSAD